jgi:hypothetical protein
MRYYVRHTAATLMLLGCAAGAGGQTFEAVGTRAAGMGGAFVGVADDASAAYWNPAGFASGNIFSLVVDRRASESDPAVPEGARKGLGFLFAMGMPALGLSYYQVRSTVLADLKGSALGAAEAGAIRIDTLVTRHTGATVLQSIGHRLTVGGTAKLVNGTASSAVAADGARETLLDRASELGGRQSTKFDADMGVMTTGSFFKLGLTIRNLTSPDFETPDGNTIPLQRQARAGIAFLVAQGWAVDADFDLTTTHGSLGDERNVAVGTEGQLGRKVMVRGGLRVNTTGVSRTAPAAGGSYRVLRSLFVDGQVTGGSMRADRGWGISARVVY